MNVYWEMTEATPAPDDLSTSEGRQLLQKISEFGDPYPNSSSPAASHSSVPISSAKSSTRAWFLANIACREREEADRTCLSPNRSCKSSATGR